MRWWQWDEIDKSRWKTLEDLISTGVREAKDNLERAIVFEIRAVCDDNGTRRKARFAEVEQRIWKHLENGELDPEQHAHLLKVFEESQA